jgi:hypothetical protein
MLVILSDVHLGDGTTAASISPVAFELFASRLREAAYFASFRKDGSYRPIESLNVVLMGDILDPLHSTLWLDSQPSEENYVRPWTDTSNPHYAVKLRQVTQTIFEENEAALKVLRQLANNETVLIPPATQRKGPSSRTRVPVDVNIHYMIGNHDWYYHVPDRAFDEIRQDAITAMGLSNPTSPFPYELAEAPALQDVFQKYKVYGRHGDYYDKFNFDPEKGRDQSALGDVLGMEVLNRFPLAVQERFGDELPPALVDSLRRITNVRPVLATPLWISGQLKLHAGSDALEDELKKVWDKLCDEFLQMRVVREADKAFRFDIVDALELIVKISQRTSFNTINDLIVWLRDKMWSEEISFAKHALREPAFLDDTARYIVYGHTHQHEIVSLDAEGQMPYPNSQVYLNSGTWHSYFDLAIKNPPEQKFIPYQELTYLTFYKDDEREGRQFEAWSGTFM